MSPVPQGGLRRRWNSLSTGRRRGDWDVAAPCPIGGYMAASWVGVRGLFHEPARFASGEIELSTVRKMRKKKMRTVRKYIRTADASRIFRRFSARWDGGRGIWLG